MTLVELLQTNDNYRSVGGFVTDKESRHKYCSEIYDWLFLPYKDKEISLFEIGIAGGGSLVLWNDYFSKAIIAGTDKDKLYDDAVLSKYSRIQPCIKDAYSEEFVNLLPQMDIAIDDGPHTEESWLQFLKLYVPKVKPGGILVIEDIHLLDVIPKFKEIVGDLKWACYDLRGISGAYDGIVFVVWK